jgi:hypothetical protein
MDTHLKHTINNHANMLRSLVQTLSTLMQVLKETVVLVPAKRKWWQFWKPRYVVRTGVFLQATYDSTFAMLLDKAEAERLQDQIKEAEAVGMATLNAAMNGGPDSPIYNGQGVHFERIGSGPIRMKRG